MRVEIKHRFTGATLYAADLRDDTASYIATRVVLEKAVSDSANLDGAYLDGADLRGADLRGADLRGAYLRGADLRGADLYGAYLDGAYLYGAYLYGADLRGAYLRGADLRGAYLDGEKLTKAPISILNLTWSVLVTDGHMRIGCQRHTHAEWAAFDDRQIAAMDGANALRFWRANRDWLLAACAAHAVSVERPAEVAA